MSVIDIQPLLDAAVDPKYLEEIFKLQGKADALAAFDDRYLDLRDAVFWVLAAVMKKGRRGIAPRTSRSHGRDRALMAR